jgi:hypothetical protein
MDAMTFITGAGDIHKVRLLDHATVVSGSETAATVLIDISGDENMDGGIDWLHLYFRDTRFTVTSTDCRVETQLTATVNAGDGNLPVQSTTGFSAADGIWIERADANEEQTTVAGVLSTSLTATVSMGHPNVSFVTRKTKAWYVAQELADLINTTGASVAGRFGPDQERRDSRASLGQRPEHWRHHDHSRSRQRPRVAIRWGSGIWTAYSWLMGARSAACRSGAGRDSSGARAAGPASSSPTS